MHVRVSKGCIFVTEKVLSKDKNTHFCRETSRTRRLHLSKEDLELKRDRLRRFAFVAGRIEAVVGEEDSAELWAHVESLQQ